MISNKLRVGVVGANLDSWAAKSHLPAIQASPEIDLAAVCTTRMESAMEAAEKFGASIAFENHQDMLAQDTVDAVAVSIRAPKHYDVTMDALHAGKHVYTEWPLGTNLQEAEEMANLARKQGVKTMVGLQERRAPIYMKLKEMIDNGYFGDLLSCSVFWSGSGILERTSEQRWRAETLSGTNALTVGLGHVIDPVCLCVGEFTEVSAVSRAQIPQWIESDTGKVIDVTAPDTVMICGKTAAGAVVSAVSSTVPWHGSGFRMELYGKNATAIIFGSEHSVLSEMSLMVGKVGANRMDKIPITGQQSQTLASRSSNIYFIYEMWAHFVESIRTGERPEPDFDHAVDRHRFLDAIQRASDTGIKQLL